MLESVWAKGRNTWKSLVEGGPVNASIGANVTKKIEIDMVPDIKLLEKIGATSLSLSESIIELVANCIDARAEGKLEVDIHVSQGEVRVIDNGLGMPLEVLVEAVRLGVDMDDVVDRGPRKGMYGLGMKTACAALGESWTITTRPLGGDVEFKVTFDLRALKTRSHQRGAAWRHEVEESAPNEKGILGSAACGTAIAITRLRESNPLEGAVLDAIGRAFRPNLESGDVIRVNGKDTLPPVFELVPDTRIAVNERFGPNNKYVIKGWVGLDKKTHNDDFFGINIYRQSQLIQAWDKSWFRVHLMTSRIVGELHADFLPPPFHKKGINTQSEAWRIATRHMREFLKPLQRASEAMAKNKRDPTRVARAVQGLRATMGSTGAVAGMLGGSDGEFVSATTNSTPAKNSATPSAHRPKIEVDSTTIHFPDGPMGVTYVVESYGEEDGETPWGYIYENEGTPELQAILFSDSKLFKAVKDEKFLGMLALSDSVAEFLATEKGLTPAEARRIRNKWLYAALSE